jgi:hypothetical protein
MIMMAEKGTMKFALTTDWDRRIFGLRGTDPARQAR